MSKVQILPNTSAVRGKCPAENLPRRRIPTYERILVSAREAPDCVRPLTIQQRRLRPLQIQSELVSRTSKRTKFRSKQLAFLN